MYLVKFALYMIYYVTLPFAVIYIIVCLMNVCFYGLWRKRNYNSVFVGCGERVKRECVYPGNDDCLFL